MALQERRDHEIALRLAEETGGGVEELTPSLKRSSSGEKIHTRYERVFSYFNTYFFVYQMCTKHFLDLNHLQSRIAKDFSRTRTFSSHILCRLSSLQCNAMG